MFKEEVDRRQAVGSLRLWCMLVKRIGEKLLLCPIELLPVDQVEAALGISAVITDKAPQTNDTNKKEENRLKENRMWGNVSLNVTHRLRSEAIHDSQLLSLDCFTPADIDPVSTTMYQYHTLPALFRNNSLVASIDSTSLIEGLQLPTKETAYGWYHVPHDMDICCFNCLLPQNSFIPRVSLHIHGCCLRKYYEIQQQQQLMQQTQGEAMDSINSIWRYDGKGWDRLIDHWGKYRVTRKECILCKNVGMRLDLIERSHVPIWMTEEEFIAKMEAEEAAADGL